MTGQAGVSVWDSPEFQRLLAQHHVGPAFALLRKQYGLTQAGFGALVGWDRTNTGRIEREERQTLSDIRELVRVADVLGIPRRKLLPVLLGDDGAGTIEDTYASGGDDVDRREFGLTLFGAALATAAVPAAAATAAAPTTPTKVGSDHIDYLGRVVDHLWEMDSAGGSGGLVDTALTQYRNARRLLDHGDYGTRTGTQLAGVTGRLANCTGWLAFDSGRPDIAHACTLDGLALSERAGDADLRANSVDDLRLQAWGSGRRQEALQYSLRASDICRHVPSSRLQSLYAAREAVAHAAVGDSRAAERAIALAWREADRGLDDPDDPIWLLYVTEAEIKSTEAKARVHLGHHEQAAEIYRDTIEIGDLQPRDEASYRAYYAATLAHLGDTHTAVTEGLAALTMLESSVRSPRLVAELQPVRALTTSSTDADEFRTRFDQILPRTRNAAYEDR
ncbi:helix-turn-helix transcriptional regulator [Nocardia sp. NPDC058499]|uniref:helix-turn-helix transcriptional regulator n=1 Tax=Nocardia sp. NPDC058499 TaxID=3346530 RepID=UPI00365550C0